MVYVYAMVLTLVSLLCWVGIWFGLPGTWLMVLFPVLLKWWQPDQFLVSWTVLGVAVGLAVLGEVLEFVLGAAGSRRTGGSTRGAVLALVGSIVGGIMGIALPVPVVGPLLGACPRGLCWRAAREPVDRTHALSKRRSRPGGGCWAVLGHGGQAGYRRGHRGDAGDCRLRVRDVLQAFRL